MLEPFDAAMADVYGMRTGINDEKIRKMMDAETWINGSAAVDQGFADSFLPADAVSSDANARSDRIAAYLLDTALAKAGMPRSSRRELMKEYRNGALQTSAPDAAGALQSPGAQPQNGTRGATGGAVQQAVESQELLAALRSFQL